jgi:hypothetical protein
VTDGPFSEAKELIGGFAILRAKSKTEAIEMGRRFMKLHQDVLGPGWKGDLEIRQVFDAPDSAPPGAFEHSGRKRLLSPELTTGSADDRPPH